MVRAAGVAVAYLDEYDDAQLTKDKIEAEGTQCILLPGDVKGVAYCKSAVAKTMKAFGRLDVLVNNAAFQSHCDRLEDLTDGYLQQTLQNQHRRLRADGADRAAASQARRQHHQHRFGDRHLRARSLVDYSATKGAIHAFAKALSGQLTARGIRVNAVAPGPVWTPLNPADKPAKDVAKFGADSDMGRAAQPEELSPAHVFLASPVTASYISGIVLPVMGGVRG